MKHSPLNRGQSLLELLLALALATGVIVFAVSGAAKSADALQSSEAELVARSVVRGCIDAVRSIRDASYSNLSPGEFALEQNSTSWSLTPIDAEYLGPVVTVVEIDPGTLSVTCSIERSAGRAHTEEIQVQGRVTNWKKNAELQKDVRINVSDAAVSGTSSITGMRICNEGEEERAVTAMRLMWADGPLLISLTLNGIEVYGPSAQISSNELLPVSLSVSPSSCTTIDEITFSDEIPDDHLFIAITIEDALEVTRHIYLHDI